MLNNNTGSLERSDDFRRAMPARPGTWGRGDRHWDLAVGVRNLFDQRQKDLETGVGRHGPPFALAGSPALA